MKIGIQQSSHLVAQAFAYQANQIFLDTVVRHDGKVTGDALYAQIQGEAEKSHAALRVLQRDVEHPSGYVTHAASAREPMTPEKKTSILDAIALARTEIDRIMQTYLPQKIAA